MHRKFILVDEGIPPAEQSIFLEVWMLTLDETLTKPA